MAFHYKIFWDMFLEVIEHELVIFVSSREIDFDEFINYITINVSEFYRNTDQWEGRRVPERADGDGIPLEEEREEQLVVQARSLGSTAYRQVGERRDGAHFTGQQGSGAASRLRSPTYGRKDSTYVD